jgi:putative ABC transport system permease protein
MNDLKFAFRQLLKNPGFTTVAVLTLALGIGATTAIFTVINGVLLKPLPYEQPGQLVNLWESPRPNARNAVSGGVFLDWREHSTCFEGYPCWVARRPISQGRASRRIKGLRVCADYLRICASSRSWDGDSCRRKTNREENKVAVLSHACGNAVLAVIRICRKSILLDGESRTVVGCCDQRCPPKKVDFLVPFVFGTEGWERSRSSHSLRAVARLKPGFTPEQARTELAAIMQRLQPEYPKWKEDWSVSVVPMHEQVTGE